MTDRLPRVVYWNNQPSPYVVDRFNAVASTNAVDFEAWFDNYRETDRSWDVDPSTWRFPAVALGTTDNDHPLARIPLELVEQRQPDLLISNYDRLHMVLGLIAAKPMVARTAVRCLPTWPAWDRPSATRSAAKHILFRAVDGAKVPGPDGAAYARRFGLPVDRTWPVTQSVDLGLYSRARSTTPQRRAELRAAWGVTGCAFVYVGRLWHGKGVAQLIDAFRDLVAERPDSTLLLVGDGPDEAALRQRADGVPNVRWIGFVQPNDLPDVYAAGDVLVFPTLGDPNGLVVEEAMAAGLPVISTSAAGDIRRRLPDGVAGYVVEPGQASSLVVAMRKLADDPTRRAAMGKVGTELSARADAHSYSRDFLRFTQEILDSEPRRSLANAIGRLAAPPLAARIRAHRTVALKNRLTRYGPAN